MKKAILILVISSTAAVFFAQTALAAKAGVSDKGKMIISDSCFLKTKTLKNVIRTMPVTIFVKG